MVGCSTRGNPAYKKALTKKTYNTNNVTSKKNSTTPNKKHNYITASLYKEYQKWQGTPYQLGGDSFNGVDCSSFIQSVYKNAFNIKLPRTTREQVKKGYKVSRSSHKVGDLIFFKTGYNIRHTGIVIEKGKFMHTSQKHGVTISDIYNPYWNTHYWQIRRILP